VRILSIGLFACLLLLTACGGSSSNSSQGSLSGNWQIALQRGDTGAIKTQTGFLLQSGTSITGQVLLTQTGCAGVGTATGEMSGSSVAINVTQTGQTVQLKGTAAGDGSSIQGNYSLLASGCGNTQTGNWNGTRIPTLNGSFTGTFSSKLTPGVALHFNGTVAQGANTGSSSASLNGTMTSSDAPACYNNVNINGMVSGTSVVFNLLTADGTALGAYQGTGTTDMNTITGQYNFVNAQSDVLGNCGGGDFGDAVLSVQVTATK
jgi:hypothetical protein